MFEENCGCSLSSIDSFAPRSSDVRVYCCAAEQALDRNRLLEPALGAEDAQIARDFAGQSHRLVGIVGELQGRPAIRLADLADQRYRMQPVVRLGRAADEVVGEVGAPAKAHSHLAVKMP